MSQLDASASDSFDDLLLLEAAPAQPPLLLRAGAEAFGTFVFVLLGVGAAIYTGVIGGDVLATSLAFGLGAAAALAVIANVSGGHINPAVTLGAAVAGRLRWLDVPVYWLAQVLGSVLAAVVLRATIPATFPAALNPAFTARDVMARGANGFGEAALLGQLSQGQVTVSVTAALIIEIVLTMILVAVVLAVTSRTAARSLAPLWVGITMAAAILVAMPFTGGSVNPARSLGVAFLANDTALSQVWVFVVGPLAGALLAGLVARIIALGTAPLALEAVPYADETVEVVEISEGGELVASADSTDAGTDEVEVEQDGTTTRD
ncbi:MIP/aquaporin family protein [Sanguibacter sp. A247]|uniref:MIP/aquaporin family protein n=1 Tax=unclassified Sanguibacter TaxID=2645534 RepID=UPI003FD7890E